MTRIQHTRISGLFAAAFLFGLMVPAFGQSVPFSSLQSHSPLPPPCGCPFLVGQATSDERQQLAASGLCPYCLRCCDHIARYGHDPQWMTARIVPIKWEYPGTCGRLGYGHTCGETCTAQHRRCDKPVAYIAPEYVAAINRAVAEQYAAKAAAAAANRADAILLQQEAFCEALLLTLSDAETQCVAAEAFGDLCVLTHWVNEVNSLRMQHHRAEMKRESLLHEAMRRDYIYRNAIARAEKSKSTANVASHRQRAFVKSPFFDKSLLALPDMLAASDQGDGEGR